jgi:hypothetical protein
VLHVHERIHCSTQASSQFQWTTGCWVKFHQHHVFSCSCTVFQFVSTPTKWVFWGIPPNDGSHREWFAEFWEVPNLPHLSSGIIRNCSVEIIWMSTFYFSKTR